MMRLQDKPQPGGDWPRFCNRFKSSMIPPLMPDMILYDHIMGRKTPIPESNIAAELWKAGHGDCVEVLKQDASHCTDIISSV